MLEVKHVPFDECLADLLVGPCDEHFVVVVGAFGEAGAEVDWDFDVHAFPVGLEKDAEFLGAAEGEDRNQNLEKYVILLMEM